MFSSPRTSNLGQRAFGALGLLRSFLLLEDDYEVDWEVGQDELSEVDHPHRAALRGRAIADRLAQRRPGQPAPRVHVCLCPIGAVKPASGRIPARREDGASPAPAPAAPGELSAVQISQS
jgi:hypothetical protein